MILFSSFFGAATFKPSTAFNLSSENVDVDEPSEKVMYGELSSIWISALYNDPEYVTLRDELLQAFPFHVVPAPFDTNKSRKSRRSSGSSNADSLDYDISISMKSSESTNLDMDHFSHGGLFDWETFLSDPSLVPTLIGALRHNDGKGDVDSDRFEFWNSCLLAQVESSCKNRENSNLYTCLGRFLRNKYMKTGRYSDCHIALQSSILYACSGELTDYCSPGLPFSSQVTCLVSLVDSQGETPTLNRWRDKDIDERFTGEEFKIPSLTGVRMTMAKNQNRGKKRTETGLVSVHSHSIPVLKTSNDNSAEKFEQLKESHQNNDNEPTPDRPDYYTNVLSESCSTAMASTQWTISQLESIIKGRYQRAFTIAKNGDAYYEASDDYHKAQMTRYNTEFSQNNKKENNENVRGIDESNNNNNNKHFLSVVDSAGEAAPLTSAFSVSPSSQSTNKGLLEEVGWVSSPATILEAQSKKLEGHDDSFDALKGKNKSETPSIIGGDLFDEVHRKRREALESESMSVSSIVFVSVMLISAFVLVVVVLQLDLLGTKNLINSSSIQKNDVIGKLSTSRFSVSNGDGGERQRLNIQSSPSSQNRAKELLNSMNIAFDLEKQQKIDLKQNSKDLPLQNISESNQQKTDNNKSILSKENLDADLDM